MDKKLMTDKEKDKLIRQWNSTFHTQFRYNTSTTVYWAKECYGIAYDWKQLWNSWCSMINYYACAAGDHSVIRPDLDTALCALGRDLIKANEHGYKNPIYYSSGGGHLPNRLRVELFRTTEETTATTEEPKAEVRKEETTMANNTQNEQAIALLAQTMADVMKGVGFDKIEAEVSENLKTQVDKYIAEKYGPITRKTTVVIGDKSTEVPGVVHEKFGEVLNWIANKRHVYLMGPAGTGKNYLCKQIATVLGLEFYFSNAITQEYQLSGFTDANGVYQPTQWYKFCTNGGVMMLDELDGSIPDVLIKLNAALANGYYDFPAPIGKLEMNPNCIIIAAGNTYGQGADYSYVGRNQLDAASLDRFGFVEMGYDPRIEESLARGDKELLGFCRELRVAFKEAGISIPVSYRGIENMAIMKDTYKDKADLIKACLTKGLQPADLKTIREKMSGFGAYSAGFNKLCC